MKIITLVNCLICILSVSLNYFLYIERVKHNREIIDVVVKSVTHIDYRLADFIKEYKPRIAVINPKLTDIEKIIILTNIFYQSEQYECLTPEGLLALYHIESNFNPSAVSNKNAVGIGQMLKTTAEIASKQLGMVKYDLKNPVDNIKLSSYWLALCISYLGEYNGYAAYYAGNRIELGYGYADTVMQLKSFWKKRKELP